MQTFKQFVETREVKNIEGHSIYNILRNIKNAKKNVEFALFCAEDCFQFNNEITKPLSQRCITLVRKWLRDSKSVTRSELISAANALSLSAYATYYAVVNADASAYAAYYAAVSAANTAVNANYSYNDFHTAISFAADASSYAGSSFAYNHGHERHSTEWKKIYDQKHEEYIQKARSLLTTRSGNPITMPFLNNIQDDDNDLDNSEYINDSILSSIMAMIDHLYDEQETGEEHFFYEKDNKLVFDLGNNVKLTADHLNDLAKKIYQNKYFLRRLKELYRANV